ncbi:hypothetical protein Dimus_018759 [Dionaea muscipula]
MGLQAFQSPNCIFPRIFASSTAQCKNALFLPNSSAANSTDGVTHGAIGRATGSYPVQMFRSIRGRRRWKVESAVAAASSSSSSSSSSNSNVGAPWDSWVPDQSFAATSLSDILWPSAGAFVAMAILGKIDQILASKGLTMTIAPQGAVCAVLFIIPSSPTARKYNIFVAQIGCAAIGVVALLLFGPCCLARSTALAASIAFMIYTRSTHPPAASLPLLFIDGGAKFHHLNFWYALFPGAASCVLLSLIQEMVIYLKHNFRF